MCLALNTPITGTSNRGLVILLKGKKSLLYREGYGSGGGGGGGPFFPGPLVCSLVHTYLSSETSGYCAGVPDKKW